MLSEEIDPVDDEGNEVAVFRDARCLAKDLLFISLVCCDDVIFIP